MLAMLECGCHSDTFGIWTHVCAEGKRLEREQRLAARVRDRLVDAEFYDEDVDDVLGVEPSAELIAADERARAAWTALCAHRAWTPEKKE